MTAQEFNKVFPRAMLGETIEPFFHKGQWAIHDVLPILLSKMGKAQVKIATFGISEDGLRPLFFLMDEGAVSELTLLLDMTVKRHKLDVLLFATSITPNIRLESNHSKILLVKSPTHAFGIVGSMNLNQPRRFEAGFYFTAGKHFDFFDKMFDTIYDEAIPYELDK